MIMGFSWNIADDLVLNFPEIKNFLFSWDIYNL